MDKNDIIKLVTAYAAGDLAYGGLLEAFGDKTLTDKIVALVGSIGVAGIAAHLIDGSVDTLRELPIAKQALEASDSVIDAAADTASDVIDSVSDVIDDINPFNW